MNLKLHDISRLSNIELPGEKAHIEMSPKLRESAEEVKQKRTDFKRSAVLIVFYENNGDLTIPLIERNIYDGTHSGQISFPGGKMEKDDIDLRQTALRETKEEIGLEQMNNSIITQLTDIYIPPSNFMVSPYVAIHKSKPIFIPEPSEVEDIIHFPLTSLLDDTIIEQKTIFLKNYNAHIKVPAYIFQEKVIWGATAIILAELKSMIKELVK